MTRRRVAVLISGRGSNMQALIKAAAKPDYPAEIVRVISNVPGAAGLATAAQAGIAGETLDHRAFKERHAFETALTDRLRACGAELVCLAGFMRLLTPLFVDAWRDRLINIHPSLLPAFPGLHTHARVLAAGVRITGCTVHFVRAEMDAGPIIAQAAVAAADGDDEDALSARVLDAEHRLYPHALALVASGRAKVEGELVRIDGGSPPAGPLLSPPI